MSGKGEPREPLLADTRPPLAVRLRDCARIADKLQLAVAAEKRRTAFTHPFDQSLLEVAASNARVCADAFRLLADRSEGAA